MTVGELIEELRDRDETLEVVVSIEMDDGAGGTELFDAPATSAYVSVGRLFITGGDDQ